jgi:hypothetical protein
MNVLNLKKIALGNNVFASKEHPTCVTRYHHVLMEESMYMTEYINSKGQKKKKRKKKGTK